MNSKELYLFHEKQLVRKTTTLCGFKPLKNIT